jgi:phosphoglycerate dehydrogenase-like enzyme
MTPVRIAVLDDYQRAADRFADWSRLGDVEVTTITEHITGPDELVAALADAAVVVAMRERTALPASILARLPALRLLVTTGMSNAVIDLDSARDLGIAVSGTSGFVTPTSEMTWALILALLRQIPREDAAVRAGGWQHTMGIDLAGKRLGLVGLGNIGRLVADVGRAFRMDVVAWSENLTDERAAEVGVTRVGKDELFSTSDVVSIHLVLSARSRGTVGDAELRSMKPSAVLVNTSRGPIVDEGALVRALESGWIAGAGLDVFDVEPLPADHPFRRLSNTVVTPHLGYVTDSLYALFYEQIVEDIAGYLDGAPVRMLVSPNQPKGRDNAE